MDYAMNSNVDLKYMFEQLLEYYLEVYHDDDSFNPEGYEEYLNGLADGELMELYEETFDS